MSSFNKRKCQFYEGKVILAPMVRQNSLPFRLLSLQYGADLVYTEELIDHRLKDCSRVENRKLNTVDFVDGQGKVMFRTCAKERDRVILQLGSNNPERALKAATIVSKDVAGIDFNFGCPKSFSLKGGMGAAMLEKPDEIKELLTYCVENLDIPISCKIRILPDLDSTIKLVKLIESCGVSAIAVHGRTKDQRPCYENNDNCLRAIAESISIPTIANGGSNKIRNFSDITKFMDDTKASSVMIARASMKNPSIFRSDNNLDPIELVIKNFLKLTVKYDNYISNSKYILQTMIAGGHFNLEIIREFHRAQNSEKLCDLFGLGDWFKEREEKTTLK